MTENLNQIEIKWLEEMGFDLTKGHSAEDIILNQSPAFYYEKSLSQNEALELFQSYMESMKEMLGEKNKLRKLSILAGTNKQGVKENFERLDFYPGEIIAIVGPTGSGKSRLLEDIEFKACMDTPTKRTVLINDEMAERDVDDGERLIALLSQNMNFVIDLNVEDFLELHGRCWNKDMAEKKMEILKIANQLSGEPFELSSNVAQLSGGQSRALMIADCALLSSAPIVLIDEIENAGINRRKALELLLGNDKLVFITTHDPILALLASKRIVIKEGAIDKVIERKDEELEILSKLEKMDAEIFEVREKLRVGKEL